MNNGFLDIPSEVPDVSLYREEEARIVKILELLQKIEEPWKELQDLIFTRVIQNLNKDLVHEARKPTPDPHLLNRITGQLEWAEKYDLSKMQVRLRNQLQGLRTQLDASIRDGSRTNR